MTPNATASSTNTLPPISTQQLFNVSALPRDVLLQYDKKHATGQLIKGNRMGLFMTNVPMTSQPSQTQTQHYYLEPPGIGHQLLTRDGTVFYLRDQGAKINQMFVSSAPTCKGNTPEHIRAWYMAFTTFAASKGKYVHPYFCFCSDHVASHRGFSIGNDDDYVQHDLSSRYVPSIYIWSHGGLPRIRMSSCQACMMNKLQSSTLMLAATAMRHY